MTALVWGLVSSAACQASEAWPISPFAGVDSLRVEVMIGAGLQPEGDRNATPTLFEADPARVASFETSLGQEVRDALKGCSIRVSDEAADVLHVMIYGRAVLPTDPLNYQVTLLEVRVLRELEDGCDCLQGEEPAIRTLLGLVPDKGLEESLIAQVLDILAETAGCRPSD